MAKKPIEKVRLEGDPTEPFYLALSIGEIDGSIGDLSGEGVEGIFPTQEEAADVLKELNEAYPTLEGFVYLCTPVAKVWRGKVRVDRLAAKTKPKVR